jgi:fucose permease
MIGELYADLTGTAFSIAFVMALVGGSALPYLTGLLGDRYGLRTSLAIVPVSVLAMAILFGVVRRRLPARHAHGPAGEGILDAKFQIPNSKL